MSEEPAIVIKNNQTNGNNEAKILEEKRKIRHYLFFFSGQQISILGSAIVSFSLIWWLTETTQSELMLGIASFASLGPMILVIPFSGVIADRVKRKPLLITVDSLQSFFTVLLTILFMIYYFPNDDFPTQIPYKTLLIVGVFITLALRGVMQAFHTPVVNAMIPNMVPQKHLSRINGLASLTNGIIFTIGPVIGAVLLNVLKVSYIMWLDGITFVIAVIPLILIKIPNPKIDEESKEKPTFKQQFKEGLNTIRNIKGLFALMVAATLVNFFLSPLGTLLPLFISKVHNGNENNYAFVSMFVNIGTIIGGLFMTFYSGFKRKIRSIAICVAILFIGVMSLIFIPPTFVGRFWVIGVILFVSLIPNTMANTTFGTTIQTIVPKEKIGRVFSVVIVMAQLISPLGNFLSGVIGEYVSIPILFTVSAGIGLLIFIGIYLFTPARNLDTVVNEKIAELKAAEAEEELEETEELSLFEKLDRAESELDVFIDESSLAADPASIE